MTPNCIFYSLWVPLGSKSGPCEDFCRFVVDFRSIFDHLGSFWSPLRSLWEHFFTKKGALESSQDLYHYFMDFELHSEGSDIEFSMVFTDPNACRQCYEKLRFMIVFTCLLRPKTTPKTTQWGKVWPVGSVLLSELWKRPRTARKRRQT